MAITLTKSTNLYAPTSSSYPYVLEVKLVESTIDTALNRTDFEISASLSGRNISYNVTGGGTLSLYWWDNRTNKEELIDSVTISKVGMTYGTYTWNTTWNVPHNEDGTLRGYFKAKFTKNKTNSYIPASGSVQTDTTTFTTIDRKATITNAPNFNDEQNPTITYKNGAGTKVTTLQACISLDGSNADIPYRDVSKTGTSYTFNLTDSERNTLRNATTTSNSRKVKFFLKTIINSKTFYETKEVTFSIINANPSIDTIDYQDINQVSLDVTDDEKQIIQNISKVKFNMFDVVALKGATLSNVAITINGVTKTFNLSGTSYTSTSVNYNEVDTTQNTNAVVVLKDSRGNTSTKNVPLTILEWSAPTGIIVVGRQNNFYSESSINVDANYSSLDDKNQITIKYQIKNTSETTWGGETTIQDNVNADFVADNNYAWDLKVIISDLFGSTTYTKEKALDVGIPIVFYDVVKRSVGVGCFPKNDNSLEVERLFVKDKEIRNDAMTIATTSANITGLSATAWSNHNVPLTQTYSSIGDKLTYSSNGIKIGSGVSKVKVSFTMLIRGIASPNSFLGGIKKNDTIAINTYQNAPSTSSWVSMSSGEVLVDVVENDVIYMFYGAGVNSSGGISIGGANFTKLTVEVVE